MTERNHLSRAYHSSSYHNKPELLCSQSLSNNIHCPPEAILAVLLHKTSTEKKLLLGSRFKKIKKKKEKEIHRLFFVSSADF